LIVSSSLKQGITKATDPDCLIMKLIGASGAPLKSDKENAAKVEVDHR